MSDAATNEPFVLGAEISMPIGDHRLYGKIIEDRGGLGVGGEQVWRVKLDLGSNDGVPPLEVDVAESRLELASQLAA